MVGDIKVLRSGAFGEIGSQRFAVATSASGAGIKAGEPVVKTLGAAVVSAMATNKPVVGTDYVVGIATKTSTETATAVGYVDVMPLVPGVVYGIKPKVAATWDTQAEYDALVGSRVLIDLTNGSYTILAADGATNGCVVMPLDVVNNPGVIAFSFREALSFLA